MKKKRSANRHDDTILIVEYVTSDSAKETVMDKVKKLILNEAESLVKSKDS